MVILFFTFISVFSLLGKSGVGRGRFLMVFLSSTEKRENGLFSKTSITYALFVTITELGNLNEHFCLVN